MTHARAWMAVPAFAVGVLLLAGAPAFAADTATIYDVTQEGMTAADGQKLADAYKIPNSVAPNGAFSYTGKAFGAVPHKQSGDPHKDESGRPVVSEALDIPALQALRPLSDERRAAGAPPRSPRWPASAATSRPCRASRTPSSTTSDREGKQTGALHARHVGLLRPDARRPAGHRAGREAAR